HRGHATVAEIGHDYTEMHLLIGKAHINHDRYDDAINELELAGEGNARLPFVHFYLGWAYFKKQDLDRAKSEFLRDVTFEPDVAYNYDRLGMINYLQQRDQEAEKNFRKALRLDPTLASSHYQLARVYQLEGKFKQ